MQPLVSIIITNHNYAEYLAEAIDSALAQSGVTTEVIVVDDGSTDGSAEVIAGYGDAVQSIFQPNKGQCAASNAGFVRSNGDVIMFLDADDYLQPGAVRELASALYREPRASKAQGYLTVIDRNGQASGHRIPRKLSPSGHYQNETLRWGKNLFRHTFTSGSAWPRWFLNEVMPLPESRLLGTDSCLNEVSTLFGRTISIDKAIAAYRVHGRNIGPASLAFNTKSIRQRLELLEAKHQYFAAWASKRGHTLPSDAAFRRARNWRFSLLAYSVALLEGIPPASSGTEFLLSPLRTGHTHPARAVFLSFMFCVVRCLPRKQALTVARRLLELPDPGLANPTLATDRRII